MFFLNKLGYLCCLGVSLIIDDDRRCLAVRLWQDEIRTHDQRFFHNDSLHGLRCLDLYWLHNWLHLSLLLLFYTPYSSSFLPFFLMLFLSIHFFCFGLTNLQSKYVSISKDFLNHSFHSFVLFDILFRLYSHSTNQTQFIITELFSMNFQARSAKSVATRQNQRTLQQTFAYWACKHVVKGWEVVWFS